MRKFCWIPILLCCLLLLTTAVSAETDGERIREAARQEVIRLSDDGKNGAWSKAMAQLATFGEAVDQGDGTYALTVQWPVLINPVPTREKAGKDVDGYVRRCLAPFAGQGKTESITLYGKIDGGAVIWSDTGSPADAAAMMKRDATSAKKSYNGGNFRVALSNWLFPNAAELPKEQPKELPKLSSVPELGAEVAASLGISPEAASWRLPPLLLVTSINSFDVSDPSNVVLTLRVHSLDGASAKSLESAKKLLTHAVAAPAMTYDEVSVYLGRGMSDTAVKSFYHGKVHKTRIHINLLTLLTQGRGSQTEYVSYLRNFLNDGDDEIKTMMSYAATLPFYPEAELIASQVLHGKADETGTTVTFDMGGDTDRNALIKVYQGEDHLWTGFVSSRMHLRVKMKPGRYMVRYGRGEGWYGEKYLFTENGEYGEFILTIPDTDMAAVHLSKTSSGNLQTSPLTWDDLKD